jgi:predicted HTH transcriptional regulator
MLANLFKLNSLFIGIDDDGKILGIESRTPKDKEKFVHRIFTLIKNRIRPGFLIRIDFEEIRNYTVAKIFVPRGEEPLYFMDGIIYIRHGDSDIKPEPELVKKILAEYAF